MYKVVLLGTFFFFTSFSANAWFEGAIKLFKGAKALTETAAEARHASKAVDTGRDLSVTSKVLDQAPKAGALGPGMESAVTNMSDLKPNFFSEVSGKTSVDIDAYRALRKKAISGDSGSMLKMSDLTRSGQIDDPGEPYYGYWLFQAVRSTQQISNSMTTAKKKAQEVCKNETDVRRSNRLFDNECSVLDTRQYFVGAGNSSQFIEQLQKKQTVPKSEK